MMGKLEKFTLAGRKCFCLPPRERRNDLPLAVLCGWELERLLPALASGLTDMLLFGAEADGGRDFVPWPAPPVWEGQAFTGEAAGYLSFLTETALPYLEEHFGASPASGRKALLGYSLGGLFALWAMGEGAPFGVFASLSGSLWYDGFWDYLQRAPLKGTEKVYLSLGDREEFGGPLRMRQNGELTRRTAEFFRTQLEDTLLEWNKGGHSKGVENRWKKALQWTAKRIAGDGKEYGETL